MGSLLAVATGEVVLACSEHDPMVSPAQLSELHSQVD
jgi:hypothetical protein